MKDSTQQGIANKSLIVTLLIVIIIAGGVYLLYKKPSVVNHYQTPSPTPASTTLDPTADWKVYRNEQYGFEFIYPQMFTISENQVAGKPIFVVDLNRKLNDTENISVSVFEGDTKLSLDSWLTILEENGNWRSFAEQTTIKGMPAFRIKRQNIGIETGEQSENTFIYVKSDRFVYRIWYSQKRGSNELNGIFNQILSTFKPIS